MITMSMKFSFDMFALNKVPEKEITRKKIFEFLQKEGAMRIHFASSHSRALFRSEGKNVGTIKLPFTETIGAILYNKFNTTLFESKFDEQKYYWSIKSEEEYTHFEEFVEEYKNIVFLKDNLDLSLTLSMNYNEKNVRTEIGELEYQAKFKKNPGAEEALIKICTDWLECLPFYKHVDCICAMPGTDSDSKSLPRRMVSNLTDFKFEDISDLVYWKSKTRSVKDAESVEEKMELLEESGLEIAPNADLKGKTVLLFDDLYMSGISMQYVAMKLKESGAKRVFGLCIVKSRSNTAR
jgi:hypothetical protein